MRKVVMVLALVVVAGSFALKQFAQDGQSKGQNETRMPEVWQNIRRVYDIRQSGQIDVDMAQSGNAGFQVAAVQIVSGPDDSRTYEIYYKRRAQ